MNCPWTRGLKEDPAVGPGLAGVSPLRPGRGPFRPDGTHRTVRAPGSLPAGAHTCADRPAAGGKVVDFALSLLVYLSHGAHVSLKASISSHVQSMRVSSKCSLHAEQGLSEEPRVGPARCPRAASVSRHARTGPKSKGTTSLTGPQLLGETCPRWRGGGGPLLGHRAPHLRLRLRLRKDACPLHSGVRSWGREGARMGDRGA